MDEATIRLALRVTARTTFFFFVAAFAGNALRDLFPGRLSIWLAAKRDAFLLAMAASHTVHLAAIIALFQLLGSSRLKLTTVLGGGLVYLLIYALAIGAMMRLRGLEARSLLGSPRFEAVALYLIWLIFALAFVPRAISGWPIYSLFSIAAVGALVVRLACLIRHRRARTAAA
jgi:methionine sulfoxide reductase heme-binding subunit